MNKPATCRLFLETIKSVKIVLTNLDNVEDILSDSINQPYLEPTPDNKFTHGILKTRQTIIKA